MKPLLLSLLILLPAYVIGQDKKCLNALCEGDLGFYLIKEDVFTNFGRDRVKKIGNDGKVTFTGGHTLDSKEIGTNSFFKCFNGICVGDRISTPKNFVGRGGYVIAIDDNGYLYMRSESGYNVQNAALKYSPDMKVDIKYLTTYRGPTACRFDLGVAHKQVVKEKTFIAKDKGTTTENLVEKCKKEKFETCFETKAPEKVLKKYSLAHAVVGKKYEEMSKDEIQEKICPEAIRCQNVVKENPDLLKVVNEFDEKYCLNQQESIEVNSDSRSNVKDVDSMIKKKDSSKSSKQ